MTEQKEPRKNVLTCDLLALQHISKKDLEKESELAKTCWWEYRGWHPTHRTLAYAKTYIQMSMRFHEKYYDYREAEFKSGLPGGGVIGRIFPSVLDDEKKVARIKRNLTGLWRGRQAADELQISYSIYIRSIFEKTCMNGWKNRPRPTQMYSDKMKTLALDAQVLEIDRYTPDFTNPLLMRGSTAPFKSEFDTWLFELGKLRRSTAEFAYRRMVQQGYITEEQASAWLKIVRDE